MLIEMNFDSEEALYLQLRNQILYAIASSLLQEGDPLPPVRQMAGEIGINMHTVNKAYAVLREEGLLSIDRHKGAVVTFDIDREKALAAIRENLLPVLAKASCQGIDREVIHTLVDEIYSKWEEANG